jgi:hypothetical protein
MQFASACLSLLWTPHYRSHQRASEFAEETPARWTVKADSGVMVGAAPEGMVAFVVVEVVRKPVTAVVHALLSWEMTQRRSGGAWILAMSPDRG